MSRMPTECVCFKIVPLPVQVLAAWDVQPRRVSQLCWQSTEVQGVTLQPIWLQRLQWLEIDAILVVVSISFFKLNASSCRCACNS